MPFIETKTTVKMTAEQENTLKNEYVRDKTAGLPIEIPVNYFPNDNHENPPLVRWRAHANLLYSNWLNYFVYQTTPYDLDTMGNT